MTKSSNGFLERVEVPDKVDPTENGTAKESAARADLAPKSVAQRSSRELLDIVHHVENAVARGTAQIEDYEAFILCRGELSKRSWHQVVPTSFR